MSHSALRGRMLKGTGLLMVATALFAAWVGWGIGGETSVRYVDDVGTALAALTACLLCFYAGIHQRGALRRFWWLLAAACGAWTLAESIWAVYELILRESVSVPSWADVGYLAAIPLAVVALICHPAMRGTGTQRARLVLDGLIVATALLFLSWTIVLGPLWQSTDLSTLGGVVALAYPFGDVVIVFFVALAIRGMTADGRLALWCLLGGLLATALSDFAYSYLAEVESYATGHLIDAGWFAGYLGIALGAFCSRADPGMANQPGASAPTPASAIVPFIPVVGALGVASIQLQLGHRLDNVAWIAAFAVVALVLARQGLLVLHLIAPTDEGEALGLKRLTNAAFGHAAAGSTDAGEDPR